MYKYNAPYAMNPQYVVIHNTQNTATAKNEIAYMNRTANYTSYHVAIDDRFAVQAIPFNRNAFHTGDGTGLNSGNRTGIGIEICYSLDGGNNGYASARYRKAEENAALYAAHVLHQYGWGVDRLKKHQDFSGKFCPAVILHNNEWGKFKNRVQAHLNAIKKGSTAASKPVKTNKPKPAPKKTVAKVPSKKASKPKRQWGWSGTFTANTTIVVRQLKKGQTMPTMSSTIVNKGSWIHKNQWVNFNRLYYVNNMWWLRFKFPTNPSAGYFYMPVGNKQTGISFGAANTKGRLWGKVTNLKTKAGNKVTNWAKKNSIK